MRRLVSGIMLVMAAAVAVGARARVTVPINKGLSKPFKHDNPVEEKSDVYQYMESKEAFDMSFWFCSHSRSDDISWILSECFCSGC